MSDAKKLLDSLTPEQRRLLELKLKQQKTERIFPLSFSQQRLWFLDQMEPGNPAYNLPYAVRLRGPLDTAAVEKTIKTIVHRHETLRTVFTVKDGQPGQKVDNRAALNWQIFPAAGWTEKNIREKLTELALTRFDLAKGPLGFIHLYQMSSDDHLLLMVMHHIISDGWSMGNLIREFSILYHAFSNGQENPLPELKIQYVDYAAWQRKTLSGEKKESLLAFWKKQLGQNPPVLDLPCDFPRPAILTNRGASLETRLPKDLAQALTELVRSEGVTWFQLFLAAYQFLLSLYSGQNDISVGTPNANRSRSETEALIGFFVNTLVIRTDFDEVRTFHELLSRVKKTTVDVFAHQDLPFEMMVEEFQPERSMRHAPYFQAFFSHTAAQPGGSGLGQLRIEPIDVENNTAKFDISFYTTETGNGLVLSVNYSTELFRESTIRRMSSHFLRILQTAAKNPAFRLAAIELPDAEERKILLGDWNNTLTVYPPADILTQTFERQAEMTPQRTALRFGAESMSYDEMNRRANRLARYLQECGVGPDSFVGLYLERSFDLVIAMYAAIKAGAAYVPLDPDYPADRIAYMAEDCAAPVVISTAQLAADLKTTSRLILLDTETVTIAGHADDNLPCRINPDNAAYMIYTSGSTGRPKGVVITHRAIHNRLYWMQEKFQLDESDRILQKTPFSFDVSVWEFFWPLLFGAELVIARPGGHKDPQYLAGVISEAQISTLHFVPSMLHAFLESAAPALAGCHRLRQVFVSGEALPVELQNRFLSASPAQLHNLYGPTEAAVDVTHWACTGDENLNSVPIGKAIANTSIYVLDANLNPVPQGMAGELHIGGIQLARNYHNRPDLTAEKFIPDPFHPEPGQRMYKSGDLVRFIDQGNVEFLGRIDHQVKLRGLRIELGEIETALERLPQISSAIVMVKEISANDKRLIAFVVFSNGREDVSAIREELGKSLPDYMVPALYIPVEKMPLTPSGKTDRKALLAIETPALQTETIFIAPAAGTEEKLAALFSELLRVSPVSAEADFFSLGGHSLLATQLIARIREAFGFELSLRAFFQAPTVRLLARQIDSGSATTAPALSIPALERSQNLPLSFAQQRLWFLDQLEPGSPFYNIPLAFRLSGALDADLLEATFRWLITRHEALRTAIVTRNGQGWQEVRSEVAFDLKTIDLRSLPAEEQPAEIQRRVQAAVQHSFDLSKAPLFDFSLARLSETDYALIGVIHHIITDNWSNQLLMSETGRVYQALARHETPDLPALPRQYADFAAWQRQFLEAGALQKQLAYWRQTLAGLPPLLELPTDRSRPTVQSYRGDILQTKLDRALSNRLRDFSRTQNVTPFMQFLTFFGLLLSRLSGQDDIAIGIPVTNRSLPETQSIFGLFLNTLVIRLLIDGQETVESHLQQVRQRMLEAFENQDIPFETLVDELHPQRDMSHTPLFQVMFVYTDQLSQSAGSSNTWQISPLTAHGGTTKFDLSLFMNDHPDGFELLFEYNTDLFDRATIERLTGHFKTLIQTLTDHPQHPVSRFSLTSSAERQLLLETWNGQTEANLFVDSFITRFEKQLARWPGAPAVISAGQTLNYDQLNQAANRLAHYLLALGAAPETIVGLSLKRSPEMIIALLAILKTGAAYLPLDPAYPNDRLQYQADDSGMKLLLTSTDLAGKISLPAGQTLFIDRLIGTLAKLPADNPGTDIEPNSLAYIIYTSGSTGRPKGTMIHHGGLTHYLNWALKAYPLEQGSGSAVHSTIAFDATVTAVFTPLLAGKALTLTPEEGDIEALAEILRQNSGFSLIKITPAHLELLGRQLNPETARQATACFIIGGENLTVGQIAFWQKAAPDTLLFNEYGPTETVVGCVVYEARHWTGTGSVPIGRAIANTPVYVLDQYLEPLPPGLPGELYISGAGVSRGYLNRPELTAEKFIPDPFSKLPGQRMYKTGDLVRWLNDGQLIFLDRLDQQVKIRGYRIEPGEIESALLGQKNIRDAIVLTRTAGQNTAKRIVAYLLSDQPPTIRELRDGLKASLPDFMIPAVFMFMDSFPLTTNGKVNRKALPEPQIEREELGVEFVAAASDREKILAAIWAEVLHVEKVGIHDNFFELGGDSILSIQVIARARDKGLFLTPLQMFQNQTIAGLAAVAGQGLKIESEQGLLSGPVALAPIQKMFFDWSPEHSEQWNQSLIFRLREVLDTDRLRKSVELLLEQHDALRLRFSPSGTSVYSTENQIAEVFSVHDLSTVPLADIGGQISAIAGQLQAAPDFINGPLLKIAYFRSPEQDRLLIIIHHLAVDGVSWRILLEDLQRFYHLEPDQPRPEKSSSYRQWVNALQNFASGRAEADADFWLNMAKTERPRLALDFEQGDNREKDLLREAVELDESNTRLLLTGAHKAYNTEINDLLLTALLRAFGRWNGQRRMLLHFEGHGRNHFDDSIDISRTIGWFTAVYPLLLDFGSAVDLPGQIKTVKEQIHAVPHNGLTYSVLRYLHPNPEWNELLSRLGEMQIIYNYLGQLDAGFDRETPFIPAGDPKGDDRYPEARRMSALEISGQISGGKLYFSFAYSRNQFSAESIRRWATAFREEIITILQHCENPARSEKTASDYKMAGLDNKKLNKVLGQLGKKK